MGTYNDKGMLEDFQRRGSYPSVHDPIFDMVRELADGRRFLDLCCHFGLLGERLARKVPGAFACGVERNGKAVAAGQAAGVTMPMLVTDLTMKTLPAFTDWLREHRVDVVVGRRCLCVLYVRGNDKRTAVREVEFAAAFARAMIDVGVQEVFIQGMKPLKPGEWPILDVKDEIEMLGPEYALVEQRWELAYLRKA